MRDKVRLVGTQSVALAAAEERAPTMRRAAVVVRTELSVRIAADRAHRSVW
jgi:hypothetical protein